MSRTTKTERERDEGTIARLMNRTDLSYESRRRIRRYVLHFLMAVGLVIILFPLYWMFTTAIRPRSEVLRVPVNLIPRTIMLEHFRAVLFDSNYLTFYKNSLIISAGVVTLTTVASTLGGYGLTRIDIPFKKTFARGILFGYMFPPILLSIPMFIFWQEIGWINTYTGLILAETAISLPFSLWLMWNFFQTVPAYLEESARIYGAPRFRTFYEIALPNAKPGMVAVAIYSFAVSWNAYTMPEILMSDADLWPLTVGVYTFTQQNQIFWGQIMAASSMMLIPAFLFVYFLQKHLLEGFKSIE